MIWNVAPDGKIRVRATDPRILYGEQRSAAGQTRHSDRPRSRSRIKGTREVGREGGSAACDAEQSRCRNLSDSLRHQLA